MTTQATPSSILYQTIHAQPAVIAAVLQDCAQGAAQAAEMLAGARRVVLAGTGTSSHAAVVGEHLLRLAGADAYATTNFDFVTYPRPLGPDDALIAISHRGSKRYGAAAIARAREAGARIVGITGLGSPMEGPEVVLGTAPSERSSTHTASYSANLAALALVAAALGERNGRDMSALRRAVADLPANVTTLLGHEDEVRPVAAALAARGRMTLAGGGPNAVTAREGALKVKESSYLSAEGFELETLLHGGLQAVEAGDVAVVIAAHGPALERARDAMRALSIIGARLVAIADERVVEQIPTDEATTVIAFPAVPEALSPALAVVPLQLLAAFTADLRGTNADIFRADDPIYKEANSSYAL